MKPINFKQANTNFTKPSGMADCGELPVFIDPENGQKVSKWKAPLWSRIKFLFHGTIWLGILSGNQPPVWLDCTRDVFYIDKEPGSISGNKIFSKIISTTLSLTLFYLILWATTGIYNPMEWTIFSKILSSTFIAYCIRSIIQYNYRKTEDA